MPPKQLAFPLFNFMNAMRSSIWMFLLLLSFISFSASAQSFSAVNAQYFGTHEGYSRYYQDGIYYLVNEQSNEVYQMSQYRSVGDFSQGNALIQGKDGFYGLIDKDLNVVLQAEWESVKQIAGNYVAVASATGNYVEEDRGRGLRKYPELSWQLLDLRNDVLFSQLKFSSFLAMYGEVRARTIEGDEVTIHLNKINVGYTDPLMKAISYLNR